MKHHPAIGFVLTCVFLDAIGIGLIIPVLPRLIGLLSESANLQTAWYGAIMVSYGLMQFCSAPVIGAISDRVGRRPVLLIGICGLAMMMIIPAVSSSLWLILLSRIVGGLMSSNIVVAQAYIADITSADNRTAAFGRIGAIFGIAFIVGPAIGGFLGDHDPRLPFIVASCLCFLNFLYGLFILPESLTAKATTPLKISNLNPFKTLWTLLKDVQLLPILSIITLYTLSQSLIQCTWALYTEHRYHWTPELIGLSIFALGGSITLTQGLLLPKIAQALRPKTIVIVGLCIGSMALAGIALSPLGWLSASLLCIFAFMGIIGPTLQAEVSRRGCTQTQGTRLGAISSLNSFTGAISPVIGTPLLLWTAKYPQSPVAGTPYFLAMSLLIVALFLAIKYFHSASEKS